MARKTPPSGAWGASETEFFYELTPDRILDAVESAGLRCTGRYLQLNSMENRVYQVEIEPDGAGDDDPRQQFRVVKFYRPGRWSQEQILEEHRFLLDLVAAEIPAVAPVALEGGKTLFRVGELQIWYALFPRVGGRAPDELDDGRLEQLGRLLARLHQVGAERDSEARVRLDPVTYGLGSLGYLMEAGVLPGRIADAYRAIVEEICSITEPWFEAARYQRIHGDCHLGNVLWGSDGAFLVDFDDMVLGPCVQDVWLLLPGRDEHTRRQRDTMLAAYERLREFDHATLRLVEPLRALRYVHFTAWTAKRWDDPAFKRVFHEFGTERYWHEQLTDLREQLALIQEAALGSA